MNNIAHGGVRKVVGTDIVRETTRKTAPQGSKGQERFDQVLRNRLQEASGVKFSAHAMDRIGKRNIDIDQCEAEKVKSAVQAASEKGARESLFIGSGYAMIVNVPNKTVVTVMDPEQMDRAVITNIDSTVFLNR